MGNIARKEWERDKYSTRRSECYISSRDHSLSAIFPVQHEQKGSALSGIENCQLEVHTRHTKQLETHRVVL